MTAQFVSIVVTDLAGPALFDEAGQAAVREHLEAMRHAIAAHDGRELSCTGEGLTAAFASAAAAVRCAIDMQLAAAGGPGLRIGVDAGEPGPGGDDHGGAPAIVARRLCDSAGAGEILASDVVAQVAGPRAGAPMRPLGPRRLRGIAERVRVVHVAWRDEDAAPAAPGPHDGVGAISVVVADDQDLLRAGFRVILEAEPDIHVVGEAADGRAAIDVVLRRRPDVALMDIRMPEVGGLEAAERILSEPGVDTAVLMLTTFDVDEYIYEALRIGASGFLLKDAPADRLLDAVRVAAAGDALLSPSITRRLIERFADAARPAPDAVPAPLAELSARELDVLRLVARGLSNAEIAAELVLGENTVRTHVAHLLNKLGLRDRVQAVVLAYETGFVTRGLSPSESR